MDEWKEIKGYEGLYYVNSNGNVARLNKNNKVKVLKGGINSAGYKGITLFKNGIGEWKSIHRLIAEVFIPNPNNLPYINHIDGNKLNNSVDNLEWCTQSHNMKHAYKTNLHGKPSKELNPNHKLTPEEVEYIKEKYVPYSRMFGSLAFAKKYNVHRTTILRVIEGVSWV